MKNFQIFNREHVSDLIVWEFFIKLDKKIQKNNSEAKKKRKCFKILQVGLDIREGFYVGFCQEP